MNTDQDYRNWQREQLDQRKKMKTRDELYELDRTQLLTEIEKASGIKLEKISTMLIYNYLHGVLLMVMIFMY